MNDIQIIDALWQRSETGLDEIQTRYGTVCMSLSMNIVGNRSDAEECVNDTLLAVWNSIPPQKPRSLLAYLCGTVRNISLSRFRKNTAKGRDAEYTVSLNELYEYLSAGDEFYIDNHNLLADAINAFLGTLNEKDRILFVRRYYFEDSIGKVASILEMTENNAYKRLHVIRSRLKKHLVKEGFLHE